MISNNYKNYYKKTFLPNKITSVEGFVARIFLSKSPVSFLKDFKFKNKKILDYSCGLGRHINFFLSLGMKVDGSEVDKSIVMKLRKKFKKAKFFVSDFSVKKKRKKYDYVVGINCIYYVENKTIEENINYLKSYCKKKGLLVISFIGYKHYVLKRCKYYKKNYARIKSDNLTFKNGLNIFVVRNVKSLTSLLLKNGLKVLKLGEIEDKSENKIRHIVYCTCEYIS